MPYINQAKRGVLLNHRRPPEAVKEISFLVFFHMKNYVLDRGGGLEDHDTLWEAIAGAESAVSEFKRRYVYPLEKRKLKENGDV